MSRRTKNTINPNIFILLMGFVGVAYTMTGTLYTPVLPEMGRIFMPVTAPSSSPPPSFFLPSAWAKLSRVL